jgi:hypothetical protein
MEHITDQDIDRCKGNRLEAYSLACKLRKLNPDKVEGFWDNACTNTLGMILLHIAENNTTSYSDTLINILGSPSAEAFMNEMHSSPSMEAKELAHVITKINPTLLSSIRMNWKGQLNGQYKYE